MAINFGSGFQWDSNPADRGDSFLARLLARKPSEDADSEASYRWGGPSDFKERMTGGVIMPVVNVVNWPDFPASGDPDKEEEQPVVDWTEKARVTTTVRVENPDDAEQYVMVKRVENITFQSATGELIRLNFTNGTE